MLQTANKKRFIAFVGVIVLLIAGAVWGILKFKNRNNPKNQPIVYEALVNVIDQKASDPTKDARSSLKKGDVIAYFPEGHNWSDTEKNSYLIVKLKLKPTDAAKLTEAGTKESKTPSGNETSLGSEASKDLKDMGPRMETVLARKYFLDLPNFDVQKFWENQKQPFAGRVFDDKIVEKK